MNVVKTVCLGNNLRMPIRENLQEPTIKRYLLILDLKPPWQKPWQSLSENIDWRKYRFPFFFLIGIHSMQG